METMPFHKYRPYPCIRLENRTWPDKTLDKAPIWCSVDLRDGNQALVNPMGVEQKLRMFDLLVKIGFKEIEIGFPAASSTEHAFTRRLIEEGLIPSDVEIQVLCQARKELIEKTFEALEGCENFIFHLYNSTSEVQRRIVFGKDRAGIVSIATEAAAYVKTFAKDTDFRFQYSPESFTGTEPEFALEICEAVMEEWRPTEAEPIVLNLPATVEMSTPNVYADLIEWFCLNMRERNKALISIHNHNDRGCAIASTELALMAGADRVEGTLFGNGERTGNTDLVTLACNLFSQGVNPELDFTSIRQIGEIAAECTEIPVHVRHPYVGDLVYTAFSGSHQDAINKGFNYRRQHRTPHWEVPYLPVDPEDLGCTYEAVIRINSQSGKGGAAYVLDEHYGFKVPKEMQSQVGRVVQKKAERSGGEVASRFVAELFRQEFCNVGTTLSLVRFEVSEREGTSASCKAEIRHRGKVIFLSHEGNGPIDAFVSGLKEMLGLRFVIETFAEHALEKGSGARAVSYVGIRFEDGEVVFGAGIDVSTVKAAFLAVLSCLNRKMEGSGSNA